LDFRSLQVFLTVAEEGSFAAAARRLSLSRSTVTERVGALEREVGTALLVRLPDVELTAAGLVFFPHARAIIDELAATTAAMAALRRPGQDVLRIGLFAGGAAELNAPLFLGLRRALPRTRISLVDLSLSDNETAIVDRRVDVAVLRSPVTDPRLEGAILFETGRIVMVAADSELGRAPSLTLADLETATLTGTNPSMSREFQRFFLLVEERGGEPPHVYLPAGSLQESAMNILTAHAIAVPSADALRVFPVPRQVASVPLVDATPSGPIAVCRAGDRRYAVRAFMAVARQVAQAAPWLVPDTVAR